MRLRYLLVPLALALLVAAGVVAVRTRDVRPPLVGFVAETTGVAVGTEVWGRQRLVGYVGRVARRDTLLRLELWLADSAPALHAGDRLRFRRGPLGERLPLEFLPAADGAPLLAAGDSLAAAPSWDERDSTTHALDALPAVVDGVRGGVRALKRHPGLWSDSAPRR